MSVVYLVTRTFHFAGMDEQRTDIIAGYSNEMEAAERATFENSVYANIANDCEIEDIDIDVPWSIDDADRETLMDVLLNYYDDDDGVEEELQVVLDKRWPEWREELAKARAEWLAQPAFQS